MEERVNQEIAVFGATGFVGRAVVAALEGTTLVRTIPTPRLTTAAQTVEELLAEATTHEQVVAALAQELAGIAVVVNAAGDPDASSLDVDGLFGANALLPAVLLQAARRAGVKRFVHVSSAVVQNDKPVLDSSEEMHGFSPYSSSKVAGEEIVRTLAVPTMEVIRYRPPSVHAPERRVTRMIARIAASPAATVARPGSQPSPQALLPNVAAAVAHLATSTDKPPAVVHHPWEGVTAESLMRDLGNGRSPIRLPGWLARTLVVLAKLMGRLHRPTAANARRVELLWLGQGQAPSWFDEIGWQRPVGPDAWRRLTQEEE